MLRCLRRNEILGILVDRPLVDDGVPVRFFGAETRVPGGAATLALRTGAGMVTAVVVRESSYYVAHIGPLVRTEPTDDRAADVQLLTQRCIDELEMWIRRYPDQWYMFRDMWPRQRSVTTREATVRRNQIGNASRSRRPTSPQC
jgi:KDO2-lipid IV(A) lauroyltransferase